MPEDHRAMSLALRAILMRKGRVLDAVAHTFGVLREHQSEADSILLERLKVVRSSIAAQLTGDAVDGKPHWEAGRVRELLREEEWLQRELSERSDEYRAEAGPVGLDQVRSRIPTAGALVEIFHYQMVNPGASTTEAFGTPRYVAYVLRREGEPAWTDLGEAGEIDQLAGAFREALSDKTRADVAELARALDERVMRPVRGLLGGARTVLLSPDGVLNLIPFGALVDEEQRYLVEGYTFIYVSSGRDLPRLAVRKQSRGAPMVVAGANYLLRGVKESRRQWAPLPRTLGEADMVSEVFPDAILLTDSKATEGALHGLRGPQVLHVATHGYFEAATPEGEIATNPLLRSGVVLAGANGPPVGDDDGMLTALELSGLDLEGTRVVVLSACETGLGEVLDGEGVYGLRRALVLAGAESQVMSLWRVSDAATRALMRGYYERLKAGEGRADALRAQQREMLTGDRRHPYYWAAFIPSGAWDPLPTGQMQPTAH
jgi:CHAT domain-containing protein